MTGGAVLPVLVIGGYLGAGKTTLVNHLLRHAEGQRIAVLVNDFGEISIDADLILSADKGVISLAGGCLCCSFGDDLVGTLRGVCEQPDPPDIILIELSGVAQPASVVRSIGLVQGVAVTATLVIADAAALPRQAGDRYVGDTVRQQLRDADWVLLGKLDLSDAAGIAAAEALVADIAPQARCIAAPIADLPAALVLGWRGGALPETGFGEGARPGRALGRLPLPASLLFAARSITLPQGTDLGALGAALAAAGNAVLRAKGFVLDANGAGWLVQFAAGRWQVTPATMQGEGRLVVIGLRKPLEAWGMVGKEAV